MGSIYETDGEGKTALHWAASGSSTRIVEMLIRAGNYPLGENYNGITPWRIAELRGLPEMKNLMRRVQCFRQICGFKPR